MATAVFPVKSSQFDSKRVAALGAVTITLLAAIGMSLFSTEQAVGGGWLERAAIPARMLLLVAAATRLLRWAGETWRSVGFERPASLWRAAGLVMAGYLAIGAAYALTTKAVLPALGLAPKTMSLFAGLEGDTAEYLYWLLPVVWGSAAFGEELLFRGYLQTRLHKAFGGAKSAALPALVVQAAIFGALHSYQGLGGAIMAGSTGLVLGAVYLAARKNLWAPIILHGLVDTISISAIYFGVAGQAG
jgi:membrane protease YdiL (CAAX protease family)